MIYFVQAESGGPIKIGFALNVAERVKTLQTSHPERLKILAVRDGDRSDERALHAELSAYRLEGEWFTDCPEVQVVVARCASGEALQAQAPLPGIPQPRSASADIVEELHAVIRRAAATPKARENLARLGLSHEGLRKIAIGERSNYTLSTIAAFAELFHDVAWTLARIGYRATLARVDDAFAELPPAIKVSPVEAQCFVTLVEGGIS